MTKRINREKHTIRLMIEMYCNAHHHPSGDLCDECSQLDIYTIKRTDACRFGDKKPACANCKVHCYKKDMREKVKLVMQYSGPRMIWKHPGLALLHVLDKYRHAPEI